MGAQAIERFRDVRLLGLVGLLLIHTVLQAAPALGQERPQRIVSLNMCTDQLVLALADPDQIVGLSRFSGNTRMSFAADEAAPYPQIPAAAEAALVLEPDLILVGHFTNQTVKTMLRRFEYPVEEVPFALSLDDAREAIRLVAEMVGHPARGEALIADLDDALDAERSAPVLSALLVQRGGYTRGTASMTGDLLAALGIALASEDLVGARGGFADLETIIRAEPDVLITANLDANTEDQGAALLAHPALADRYPPRRRLALPERLTLCAGPSLIEAVRHIARERDAALERLAGG